MEIRGIIMKALKTFLITLVVVVAVGAAVLFGRSTLGGNMHASMSGIGTKTETASKNDKTAKKPRKVNKFTKFAVNAAVDAYLKNSDDKTKEIADKITDEDRDVVTDIIASNVSAKDIPALQKILSDGDPDAVLEYAQDNFPEEDIEELQEILSGYGMVP